MKSFLTIINALITWPFYKPHPYEKSSRRFNNGARVKFVTWTQFDEINPSLDTFFFLVVRHLYCPLRKETSFNVVITRDRNTSGCRKNIVLWYTNMFIVTKKKKLMSSIYTQNRKTQKNFERQREYRDF